MEHDGSYALMSQVAPQAKFRRLLVGSALLYAVCTGVLVAMHSIKNASPQTVGLAEDFMDGPGGPGAPLAKRVVVGMDTQINFHMAFDDWPAWSANMRPYWTEDMVYDFSFMGDWFQSPMHGLRAWFDGEHMHYNTALPDCQFTDFIRAGHGDDRCTSASYGIARWVKPIAGVPPPSNNPIVVVPDLDFYSVKESKIAYNWCLIDVLAIFDQVGIHVLPAPTMPYLGYKAPKAMDGSPAPLSISYPPSVTAESEKVWRAALAADYEGRSDDAQWWHEDALWYGPSSIGTATSRAAYATHFLQPLHAAFTDIERKEDLLVCEGTYCGSHMYVYGTHKGTWLGKEPTGMRVPLRCGAHARIVDGKIKEAWLIIDIPLAFHAMGVDLFAKAAQAANVLYQSPNAVFAQHSLLNI
jgi:predicted ester cyclase